MKKVIKATAAVLSLVMTAMVFSSCKAEKVANYDFSASSILSSATLLDVNGNSAKAKLKGTDGDYIDIVFPKGTLTVDTVVLYENGENITDYEIFAEIDGELQSIYKQDKVGSFRYCAFADTETDHIRVKVNATKDGKFNIKKLDVLNTKTSRDDFRVASYVIADRIYDESKIDPSHFAVITDAILFGAVTFDENGSLNFAEYDIDGQKVNGKDVLIKDIETLRAIKGDDLKIYINVLGPSNDDTKVKEQLHTDIFNNKAETLNNNIVSLISELNLDGIYFDYEYPYTSKGWSAYSKYLISLKNALGDKFKLGIALGAWGKTLDDKAKEAVDYIEVMAYDMFDKDGYHASFASTGGVLALDYTNKRGYDIKKCDLGVPFYARPTDKDAKWFDYSSAYKSLGKFGNLDTSAIEVSGETDYNIPRYYNCYQMIFDKTAYSYDCGVGGMMIWHYSCDAPTDSGLSLFSAMYDAVNSRKA